MRPKLRQIAQSGATNGQVPVWDTDAWVPDTVTSGGGVTPPTVVGQTITYVNNTNSATATFPAGIAVGDLMVLHSGHGWDTTVPSGWTQLHANTSGAQVRGLVAYKFAGSGDVSAGSVSLSFAGSFYGEVIIAAASGASGVRSSVAQQSGSGASSVSLTVPGTSSAGDLALFFGMNRASSSATTFNRGTLLASRTSDTSASAGVAAETLLASGSVSVTVTHSVAGTGYWDSAVVLAPA